MRVNWLRGGRFSSSMWDARRLLCRRESIAEEQGDCPQPALRFFVVAVVLLDEGGA